MKPLLTEKLICPICMKNFRAKSIKKVKNEIIEGYLVCSRRHRFSIKNGIPRLVLERGRDFIKTEDAFSAKWKNYNRVYHSKKWYSKQRDWFLERFGWKNSTKFNNFLKTRSKILDAGTGIGNSAKLFSSHLKSEVFAIDASKSIEFAYKKYGKIRNIHFIQADIRRLPFKKKFFDFICSDQVLHHTKDTRTSFLALSRLLKKDGIISIYVYNKKSPMREYADDYIRERTVKMTEEDCIEFSKDMAMLGKSLTQLKKKITIPKDIPILGIKKGTYDVQRFIYWNFLKCFWAEDGNLERSVGVNFDWYFPKYAHRHTAHEVKKWFKEARLKLIHFNEIESGINVSGKKLV